jgi:hypothetical protein
MRMAVDFFHCTLFHPANHHICSGYLIQVLQVKTTLRSTTPGILHITQCAYSSYHLTYHFIRQNISNGRRGDTYNVNVPIHPPSSPTSSFAFVSGLEDNIIPAIKCLKGCHAGLNPASSLFNGFRRLCRRVPFRVSGYSRNDGNLGFFVAGVNRKKKG